MNEFNKKIRERWQQKRSKAMNWTSLLIKILILVAILFVINKLSKSSNIDWSKVKARQDTVQTDSVR
jgi:uncharacterized membrane protein SpoIIM required for sporulation